MRQIKHCVDPLSRVDDEVARPLESILPVTKNALLGEAIRAVPHANDTSGLTYCPKPSTNSAESLA